MAACFMRHGRKAWVNQVTVQGDDQPADRSGRWDPLRSVLRLAIPSAGELLLGMLVGLVNTYLVGHLGAASLTAVGLSAHWVMIAMVVFSAVGTGATALIARMVGAGERDAANAVLAQALGIGLIMGVLAVVVLQVSAYPALRLMGAEKEALALGVPYLRLVSSVYVFSAVMFVGSACLRGAGDTRTPLLVMGLVNLLNVSVSWVLVNGSWGMPRLGVMGAAVGEMTARTTGCLLILALLWRGRSGLSLRWSNCRYDRVLIRRILKIGYPAGIEQLVFRLGMLIFVRIVSALGTVAFAAHQVALNSESLSFMPGFGFAVAATTLVGQGLGARDEQRAERDGYIAFMLSAGLMSVMGVAFVLFARPIVGFFTSDPQVIEQGVLPLRLIGLVQPFLAAMMVFAGALRGAGETLAPMLINGGCVWLLRVPLALLFTRVMGWGLIGAWLAMALDITIRGILLAARFRRGKWKNITV